MTKKKDLELKKVRPKKLNVGRNLGKGAYALGLFGATLASEAIGSLTKRKSKSMNHYSLLSLISKKLIDKISLEPDELEIFLINRKLFKNNDPDLQSIMAYARTQNIIYSRFSECYSSSIASNPSLLEKFFKMKKISQKKIEHILNIFNSLISNLSKDEVDRTSIDLDEKNLVRCLLVQFKDPESKMMGISTIKKDDRFDFFKEWCTTIYPSINPDVSLRSGSRTKRKNGKKKTKRKKKNKK